MAALSILASIEQPAEDELTVWLRGVWSVHETEEVVALFKKVDIKGIKNIIIDGSHLESIDLSAAWSLWDFIHRVDDEKRDVTARAFDEREARILNRVAALHLEAVPKPAPPPWQFQFLAGLGKFSTALSSYLSEIITFFGKVCVNAVARQLQRAALPWRSVFYHIYEIGVRGLPIVCLLSFLISIVLGYQGAVQLRKFGASIFTINLVAISMLREMGVVITSIIVAGRTGSAFAAELGVMKVNQEIDALATFGLEPFRLLVLPRLLAIMIAVPILVFFADCAGLIGTLVAGLTELNLTFLECTNRMRDIITTHTFMIGLVKAPVFACLIGLTGCMQGLSVKDSAEEIGLHTTAAVVQSIFLVIAFDAMFSVIFTMLDL